MKDHDNKTVKVFPGTPAEFEATTEVNHYINPGALPDLLEACQNVINDLKHYVSTHGPGPDKRLEDLQAAIAKATN